MLDGLYGLNIYNGNFWYLKEVNRIVYNGGSNPNDPLLPVAMQYGALGAASYLLLSEAFKNPINEKSNSDFVFININSNILIKDSFIYLAGAKNLSKLDFKGNKIWEKELDLKTSSRSKLFLIDTVLLHINDGKVLMKNFCQDVSMFEKKSAYFKTYNANNGAELYKYSIPEVNGIIKDYRCDGNYLYFMYGDMIIKQNLHTNKIENEFKFSGEYGNYPLSFNTDDTEVNTKNGLMPLNKEAGFISFCTSKNNNIQLSKELQKIKEISNNFISYNYLKNNNLKFYEKNGTTKVKDIKANDLFNLDFSRNTKLIENYFIDVDEFSVKIINLKDLK